MRSFFLRFASTRTWKSAEIGLASGLREIASVLRFLETRGCHLSHAVLIGVQQTSHVACVVESVHLMDHQTEIGVGWSSNSKICREDSGPRVFCNVTHAGRSRHAWEGRMPLLPYEVVIWFRVATIGTCR
jgi:hypothetical protein